MAELVQPFGYDGACDIVGGFPALKATNWVGTTPSGTGAYTFATNATTGLMEGTITTVSSSLGLFQLQESQDGGTTAIARFQPLAGTKIWMEASVKLSEVTTKGFIFGFADVDTTLLSSGLIDCTDLIGFYSATTTATLIGTVRTSSTSTSSSSLKTLVAATYYKLGILIDGISAVTFFVNDVATGSASVANLPTAVVAPSIAYAANDKTCIFKNLWYGQSGLN
jgi:hypothetical protein